MHCSTYRSCTVLYRYLTVFIVVAWVRVAGFDGLASDPLGGDLGLSTSDFTWATHAVSG